MRFGSQLVMSPDNTEIVGRAGPRMVTGDGAMSLIAMAACVIGVATLSTGLLWLGRRSPWNERFA